MIKLIHGFKMTPLDRLRTIRVYLPPNYEVSERRYPVIYMHDAQNLFDVETSSFGSIWDVASILDERYLQDSNEAYIVVGIDNGNTLRYDEYCPWVSEIGGEYLPHALETGYPGGHGFEYSDFLATTLKPYIDQNYRTLITREHTAMIGSSMGGLISICSGIRHQNIFSKIGALSSAFYFAENKLVEFIIETGKTHDMKIYLDVGTKETSNLANKDFPSVYVNCNQNIYHTLKRVGFTDIKNEVIEGATHCEDAWKERLPQLISWLFKDK
ncbi:MAG: alpha/beta hydrolase [Turicibacter sp.]